MPRYLLVLSCFFLSGTALAVEPTEQLQSLIERQEYTQAVRSGEEILLQKPGDARAGFLTAYAYQMNANTEKAISLYQELIRNHPSLPEPRNNLALIYLSRGDYDRASELLVDAINTHSSYATAYANLNRVYKGIASEAYRRAVSESSEPVEFTADIQLTAITSLDGRSAAPATIVKITEPEKPAAETRATPAVTQLATAATTAGNSQQSVVNKANYNTLLIEVVRNWASAWSNKEFDEYTANYTADYRARFASHAQWVNHRRSRILRPGDIEVVVSNFAVKLRDENRASVDFIQAFSSPTYKDRVVKRLDFKRVDSQWKITAERVLSVL